MQLNKQRLQLWLDGKVAAYNNGSAQDIEMIQRLCEQSEDTSPPKGGAIYYVCDDGFWVGLTICENIPHHPASWFFEQEEPDTIEQRLEALEKAVNELRVLINNKK